MAKKEKEKIDVKLADVVVPEKIPQGIRSLGEMKLLAKSTVITPPPTISEAIKNIYKNKTRTLKKVMFIVDDENVALFNKMALQKTSRYQINYVLTNSEKIRNRYWTLTRIYPLNVNIASIFRYDTVDEIICCITSLTDEYTKNLLAISCKFGVRILFIPEGQQPYTGEQIFDKIEGTPIHKKSYVFKKILEISFSSLFILCFCWLLLLIAILIKLSSPGPIIFKQLRVGLRTRKFYIYKFRTMIQDAEDKKASLIDKNEADGPMFKILNDPRITKIGKFLRKTNLDELPQLFNVIKGNMSLIGPRPMLPEEVDKQDEWQLKRFSVKPGITGLWQIQPDKNDMPFNKWMKYDNEYVETWSFKNDFILLVKTLWVILQAEGR